SRHLHSFPTRRSSDLVQRLVTRHHRLILAKIAPRQCGRLDLRSGAPNSPVSQRHLHFTRLGNFSVRHNSIPNITTTSPPKKGARSEEHTSELQSRRDL